MGKRNLAQIYFLCLHLKQGIALQSSNLFTKRKKIFFSNMNHKAQDFWPAENASAFG